MYELALIVLKATGQSPSGHLAWGIEPCGCHQLLAGGRNLLATDVKNRPVDLARSAVAHLISLNFMRRVQGGYQITQEGKCFADSYDVAD